MSAQTFTTKLLVLLAAALIGVGTSGCLAETGEQDDYEDLEEHVGQVDEPLMQGESRKVRLHLLRTDCPERAEEAPSEEEKEPDPEPWLEGFEPAPQPGGGNNEESEGNAP